MNRTWNIARPIWNGLRLGGAVVALMTVGCTGYRVTEVDASDAMRFNWNGRVRITERSANEPLYVSERQRTRRAVIRIDLLGENGRNVVIHPLSDLTSKDPYACVQDVGSPPDQYLVPARRSVRDYERAWQAMLACEGQSADSAFAEECTKAVNEAVNTYNQVEAHIKRHEFDQVSGAQLAFACAAGARQIESKYRLDESTWVRVSIDDGSLLTVTVEDLAGNVLHRYAPQPVPAAEVEDH